MGEAVEEMLGFLNSIECSFNAVVQRTKLKMSERDISFLLIPGVRL